MISFSEPRREEKKAAAVVFLGVNKCHGQKLTFMPMTDVHAQRTNGAHCIQVSRLENKLLPHHHRIPG